MTGQFIVAVNGCDRAAVVVVGQDIAIGGSLGWLDGLAVRTWRLRTG